MHLKDPPGSFLQLLMVLRVKGQLHCLATAVVVGDGRVQLHPQDGLRPHASWERPVLTRFTCIREHQNRRALVPTIVLQLETAVIHGPPQQVDGPPQKTLEPRTKIKRLCCPLPDNGTDCT